MKKVPVQEKVYRALERIAEHEGVSVQDVVHSRLRRALEIERDEFIAAHPPTDVSTQDTPYVDQCSEAFLRQVCGDDWVFCWYAAGCWIPGGTPTP